MNGRDLFDEAHTGATDPHQSVRDYDLSGGLPLAGLLDNPWYPPYVWDSLHTHNCMEIGVCLCGSGRIGIAGRMWRFRTGSVAVVPRGVEHLQNNEGMPLTHWRYVLVNEAAWLEATPPGMRPAARRILERMPQGVYFAPDSGADEITAIVSAMFRRFAQCRTLDDLELDAGLRVLMALLARMPEDAGEIMPGGGQSRRAIEPALQYVSDNYTQEIRVEQMAAACAMSESYFRKVFQSATGMPPLEYVNRYRVNRSVQLLSMTDETVLTIAGMTGFPSIATYNRNFRRYVGQSPAQWRKNARK
ncbi:MAG: helix-turn-helix transcriptional regulator [Clostridia bacterium]|nr:helix-turn-helix transcriptional regulator [Clostridia bacterium]